MGSVVYSMMVALGEMTTLFPVSGSFVGVFCSIQKLTLKLGCRHIMLLGGWTLLSVLLLATTTGIRMQSLYPPKLLQRQSSFHIGIQNQSRSMDYGLLGRYSVH
jgi:hypothetical protein